MKKSPSNATQEKKKVYFSSWIRAQSPVVGKSRHQEHEAAGQIVFTAASRDMNAIAEMTLSSFHSLGYTPRELESSHLVNQSNIIPEAIYATHMSLGRSQVLSS